MRCPKCSFISFDDLATCAKCANDLSFLGKELNGTGRETKVDFFLGSAIQAPGLEDEGLSESQVLPPIPHEEINFDSTSSGAYSRINDDTQVMDLDDGVVSLAEDDVSIELGDIMPIDLDQLDTSAFVQAGDLDQTDSVSFDEGGGDLDATEAFSLDNDIDLDLTGRFAATNLDVKDSLSAIDLEGSSSQSSSDLDLDEDLLSALGDSPDDDLDATAALPKGFSPTGESTGGYLADEESLMTGNYWSQESPGQTGSDFQSEPAIQDLTGELSPIATEDDPELSSLDLSDIDVSDLIEPDQDFDADLSIEDELAPPEASKDFKSN